MNLFIARLQNLTLFIIVKFLKLLGSLKKLFLCYTNLIEDHIMMHYNV